MECALFSWPLITTDWQRTYAVRYSFKQLIWKSSQPTVPQYSTLALPSAFSLYCHWFTSVHYISLYVLHSLYGFKKKTSKLDLYMIKRLKVNCLRLSRSSSYNIKLLNENCILSLRSELTFLESDGEINPYDDLYGMWTHSLSMVHVHLKGGFWIG